MTENDFEKPAIHGYRLADIERVLNAATAHTPKIAGMGLEIIVPAKNKQVGSINLVFDGEEWLLDYVKSPSLVSPDIHALRMENQRLRKALGKIEKAINKANKQE